MNFLELEHLLDIASNDDERITLIERNIQKLRAKDAISALLTLANLYKLKKNFIKASYLYETLGMHDEAAKTTTRFT